MERRNLARFAIQLTRSSSLKLVTADSGWPSIVRLVTVDRQYDVALHMSRVGSYFRQPYESRFQNPASGRPIDDSRGFPVLLGIDEKPDPPVLVGLGGTSRVGRTSRFSILFNNEILEKARISGLSRYISSTNEEIVAFRSELLETFLEASCRSTELPVTEISRAAQTSGWLATGSQEAAKRARRAANILVRHRAFSRDVRFAYGHTCAMCGLGIDLVVGAHIYPATAPNSPDSVENGICLCPNHHAAYDNFDIWVEPKTLKFTISPPGTGSKQD